MNHDINRKETYDYKLLNNHTGKFMINVTLSNKIYILSIYEKTGGPRSLHQLGYFLQNKGGNVSVFYCNQKHHIVQNTPLYDDLNIKLTDKIEDDVNSIIVIPETLTNWRHRFVKARVVIWWLSLDYYMLNDLSWAASWGRNRYLLGKWAYGLFYVWYFFKRILKHNLSPQYLLSSEELQSSYHLYNCEYINNYLKKRNVSSESKHYLCGPLEDFFGEITYEEVKKEKKDRVVYNPAKVNENYMKKVIKSVKEKDKEIEFIPIKNMTRRDVKNNLSRAKVYADFGYFPGPERMPREAVCFFCNLITSTLGSAGDNDLDIPIPIEVKHDVTKANLILISEQIIELVKNYDKYNKNYDEYRKKVRRQIGQFESDVNDIFEICI